MEKQPILLDGLCGEHPQDLSSQDSKIVTWLKARVPLENQPSDPKWPWRINMAVYSKLEHTVMGTEYKCKILYSLWLFQENFWTTKYKSSQPHQPLLSDFDCWRMVRDKMCRNTLHGTAHQMTCTNTSCDFLEPPVESYAWGKDINIAQVYCSFSQIEIIADSEDKYVYGSPC